MQLDSDYLARVTDHGDPVVAHGYAVTGHVAQGLTTDRAFVLASDELYREWAYTAMSRGRELNRLYVVDNPRPVRDEIAPTVRSAGDAELVGRARQSRRQKMAIDVGDRPLRPQRGEERGTDDRSDAAIER